MLFADDVMAKEVAKEAVKNAIDVQFWTVNLPLTIGAFITGMGGVVLTALAVYSRIIAEIRKVFPAVAEKAEKVDSAVKEAVAAKSEAITAAGESKDYAKTTAKELGTVIGKQVGADAKAAAAVLADVTVKQNVVTNEKLERIAKAVHGPGETDGEGGICLTAKVAKLESRMVVIENLIAEGFERVLQEVQTKIKTKEEIEEARAKEAGHNQRNLAQAAQFQANLERAQAEIAALKEAMAASPSPGRIAEVDKLDSLK